MKFIKKSGSIAAFVAVGVMFLFVGPSLAQFPPRGDDATTSLGSFRIYVLPAFRPLMAGYLGYNPSTFRLNSPILFDPATIIGRSDPHQDGDGSDIGGTPVGNAGTMISDGTIPLWPDGFQGPPGTREVHTEVYDLNMTYMGGAVAVRAGIRAPARPISPGEVESHSASGIPANDFPAESFFDVFVEVDLPPYANFPGGTLYNPTALLVVNDTLTNPPGFPPRVVYIHGNTTAVPVWFLNADPGGAWQADDVFGYLVLAGHGISFDTTDVAEFDSIMAQQEEMPIPPIPTLTEWGLIIFGVVLLGFITWVFLRRRQVIGVRS